MKKTLAASVFVVAFAAYALYSHFSSTSATVATVPPPATDLPVVSNPVTAPAVPTPPAAPAAKPVVAVPSGQYKNGTYTGSVADAFYGNIQVRATVSGGKLTDVTFLQYPNDRRESLTISQQAMPVLKSEAIKAQSAKVAGVSGASDTSAAFTESLSAALTQAKA